MTNKKTTKKALLSSALSLVLCLSMLIGTTFAWFTDSVTSANNKIQAGTLKLDLELLDKESGNWNSIKTSQAPLFNYDKWEPGYTEAKVLRVENEGTLALKWMAKFISENSLSELANVIDVYVCEGVTTYPTRELAGYTRVGTVAEFVNTIETTTTGTLKAGEKDTLGIALKMQESAGNEYQGLDLGGAFDIQILATQFTYEKDSFDDQYDKNASYPGEANTVSELIEALKAGKNVRLGADIDLAGVTWESIASYSGTFDGAGHTISNLKGENGLFENLSGATVKNLKLENVDIDATSNHTGAVAGYIVKSQGKQTVIQNVSVSGTVNGGDYYVGGLVGADSNYDTVFRACTNNATVVAPGQQVGGIVGYATRATVLDNCVNNGDVTGGSFVGGIIGFAAGDDEMPESSILVKDCINNGAIAETNTTVTWAGGVGGIIGNVGRAAGDNAVKMLNFYIVDCTVASGQAIYGQKHNVLGGHENLLSVYVGTKLASNNNNAIENAIKSMENGAETVFYLTGKTYAGDIELTVEHLGVDKSGKIAFLAAEGVNPTFTGLTTLGYRNQGTGSAMFNCNVEYIGVTFDQAVPATHSFDIQDVKSINLKNCTIIGDGEYGITSARGNATGLSTFVGCTFENAGMQLLGNLATGLVIDACTFNESCINIQAGNGVTIQNCVFNKTLTTTNVNDSFYAIRTNSTPVTVKNCKINIDSKLTEVATSQAKWYLLANRGTTSWTVEDVAVTLTDAALLQTELKITACTSTGAINTTNLTVNGVVQ